MTRKYNPYKKPKAKEWLALSEDDRIDLVEKYHRRVGELAGSNSVHAEIHVVVENQLAMGIQAVREAFLRLRKSGLDRHECIHAIGATFVEQIPETATNFDEAYFRGLEQLTAESWLKRYGPGSG